MPGQDSITEQLVCKEKSYSRDRDTRLNMFVPGSSNDSNFCTDPRSRPWRLSRGFYVMDRTSNDLIDRFAFEMYPALPLYSYSLPGGRKENIKMTAQQVICLLSTKPTL